MPKGDSTRPERPSLKGHGVALDMTVRHWHDTRPVTSMFERFEPLGQLGQGGMGRVWVARDRHLARTVALKLLSPELAERADLVQQFLTEAQVAAQLEHPNIVPVYGLEHDRHGRPAFVMQLVEGETLEKAINRWAHFPSRQALDRTGNNIKQRLSRLLPVCDAVHYAHERGVVHRDLKPSNILIGRHDEILVTDWGLARVIPDLNVEIEVRDAVFQLAKTSEALGPLDSTRKRTSTSTPPPSPERPLSIPVFETLSVPQPLPDNSERDERQEQPPGTLVYMSPEQSRNASNVTSAADQFSLALIAYELVTLRRARDPLQPESTLKQWARDGTYSNFVDIWNNDLDAQLSAILRRALRFSPTERYPSVRAFAADLNHYIRGEAVSVFPDSVTKRFVRKLNEHPIVTTFVFVCCLLVGTLATLYDVWTTERKVEQASRETVIYSRLTSRVSHHAHDLESRMLITENNVTSLLVGAVERIVLDALPLTGAELENATVTTTVERSRIPPFEGTLTRPGFSATSSIAPTHTTNAAELRDKLFEFLSVTEPLLVATTTPLRTGFPCDGLLIGLDAGVYIELPTDGELPQAYDPRVLDWYKSAKKSSRPIWLPLRLASVPKRHELGLLVPLQLENDVIGVLGVLIPIDELTSLLELSMESNQRCSALVSEKGEKYAVNRRNTVTESCTLPKALLDEIAKQRAYGYIKQDNNLWFYDRLDNIGWYYVAEFAAPVLSATP